MDRIKIKKKEAQFLKFHEIEIREPLVEDLIYAERVTGSTEGVKFALAVLSRIATFDGKQLVPEELQKLRVKDFFELSKAIEDFGLEELAKELLSSQEKQASSLEK
jgi:hypothetical protein